MEKTEAMAYVAHIINTMHFQKKYRQPGYDKTIHEALETVYGIANRTMANDFIDSAKSGERKE